MALQTDDLSRRGDAIYIERERFVSPRYQNTSAVHFVLDRVWLTIAVGGIVSMDNIDTVLRRLLHDHKNRGAVARNVKLSLHRNVDLLLRAKHFLQF